MQTPNASTQLARIIACTRFLIAALGQTAGTADLVGALRTALDALLAAVASTSAAADATIAPRVAVRFAERDLEQAIRHLFLAAQALDGGKARGRIASALFPSGLMAAITPKSAEQTAAATQLLSRLEAQADAEPLRAVHAPALHTAIDAMTHRLAERDTAIAAYETAVVRQAAARDQLVRAYDSTANSVRARFPKDRAQQDLFFDILRDGRKDAQSDAIDPTPTTPVVATTTSDHA
jgi:hypothetical protein